MSSQVQSESQVPSEVQSENESQSNTQSNTVQSFDIEKFCSEQVTVPQNLHGILKEYAKGAILTQPKNLLIWSSSYFRAVADNEIPPVKERAEYNNKEGTNGLTPGLLRVYNKQIKEAIEKGKFDIQFVKRKWFGLSLDLKDFEVLVEKSGLNTEKEWNNFLVLASRSIDPEAPLAETMEIVSKAATENSLEEIANLKLQDWMEMYTFLALSENVSQEIITAVNEYMDSVTKDKGSDMISPSDFVKNSKCPPLQ